MPIHVSAQLPHLSGTSQLDSMGLEEGYFSSIGNNNQFQSLKRPFKLVSAHPLCNVHVTVPASLVLVQLKNVHIG